jgi:NAD(P)-dependent dehydrogenase (short-subunit alcohol dehydrogenase family)
MKGERDSNGRRVMFITGGSRGIGAGLVAAAASAGYDVAFTYRERHAAAAAVCDTVCRASPGVRCRPYPLDVRDPAMVERVGDQVLDDFGTVHVVVSNAAITRAGLLFSTSDEDWRDVLDTNLTGPFFVARQFLPALLANGFGRFIFVSSIAANGMSGNAAYGASKAGLLGLSGALAKEYARKGVTSNALLLSLFETDMSDEQLSDDNRAFYARYCPVGRVGQVSEVASAVLFLASDAASFVNGQTLGVNGGLDWPL